MHAGIVGSEVEGFDVDFPERDAVQAPVEASQSVTLSEGERILASGGGRYTSGTVPCCGSP